MAQRALLATALRTRGGHRRNPQVDPTGSLLPRQTAAHDHAWRRLRERGEEPGLLEGRYRCDLCSAEWAL